MGDNYREAVQDLERITRDVSRLLGWDDDPEAQAATVIDMGHDLDPDGDAAEAAQEALAEWPLGVDRHEVWTITFGMNGPTVYAEIDVSDGEVTGGRYVTSAPGFGTSAAAETVVLTDKQADTLAAAFLPELS